MMSRPTDIRPVAAALYFLPVQTRVPLKFGAETLTCVICARVRLTVRDAEGRRAAGWGEIKPGSGELESFVVPRDLA